MATTLRVRRKMDPNESTNVNRLSTNDASPNQTSIRNLGRYRNFLQFQAMKISPHYRARIESSDIVQQTLMEAHAKLEQFNGRTEPEMAKWLSQILKHNISDAVRALRRKKRDVARERPLENGKSSCAISPSDWLASEQTSPSICASNAEELLQLSEAIHHLPESQQQVIVLHHLQGRTISQVAKQLGRTTSSVAGLLYRGLSTLRNSMNRQ